MSYALLTYKLERKNVEKAEVFFLFSHFAGICIKLYSTVAGWDRLAVGLNMDGLMLFVAVLLFWQWSCQHLSIGSKRHIFSRKALPATEEEEEPSSLCSLEQETKKRQMLKQKSWPRKLMCRRRQFVNTFGRSGIAVCNTCVWVCHF